jgi:uncharacterized protein (TIGR02145 family)
LAGPVILGQRKGLSIGNEVNRTMPGNPTTYIWLDRNLGARRVATAQGDADAYGDLYQWGRGADGHESRTSPTTTFLSSSDAPRHDNYIVTGSDWRDPKNDNLWQGVTGINNPCPAGFRVPTQTEWSIERNDWFKDDSWSAYSSPLRLALGGFRQTGLSQVGSYGIYWSSTVSGNQAYRLYFFSDGADIVPADRGEGCSVRCIKD